MQRKKTVTGGKMRSTDEVKMSKIRRIPKAECGSLLCHVESVKNTNIPDVLKVAGVFVKSIVESYGKKYGLFLAGKIGCGKTKILSAIGNELISNGAKSVMYVTNEDMVSYFADKNDARIKQMMSCKVLLFDNVDLSAFSKWAPSIIRVVSSRKDNGKPTVFSTRMNKAICESWVGGRFMSLIKGYCKVMYISAPDYNDKIQDKISAYFS